MFKKLLSILLFWRRGKGQVPTAPEPAAINFAELTGSYSKVRESSEDARRESEIQQVQQQLSDLIAKHTENIGELDLRNATLRERRQRALAPLLPVENATRTLIEEQYKLAVKEVEDARVRFNQTFNATKKELDSRLAKLEAEVPTQYMDGLYPRLDSKFLSLKRYDKLFDCDLPRFAIFDLTQPSCNITAHASYYDNRDYVRTTPAAFEKLFDTSSMAASARKRIYHNEFDLKINASYHGVLPGEVRDMIRDIQEKFDHIYLIGECTYEVGKEVSVSSAPLVVGEKDGAFWVITVFDATASKDYVEREFIRGGDGQ